MSNDSHPVRDGIIVLVVSTAILGLVSWLLPNLWAGLVSVVEGALTFGFRPMTIPVVLFGLMFIATVYVAFKIISPFVARRKEPHQLTFRDYTMDEFDGVVWRWDYSGNKVYGPKAYCPNDDTELIAMRSFGEMAFVCETCKVRHAQYAYDDLERLARSIARQIDRKIRNGDWQTVVERQQQQPAPAQK